MHSRIFYFFLLICTISVGLLTRVKSFDLPCWIALYLGDILWAMMVFWIISFLFPATSLKVRGLNSLCFCFLIEVTQLYHALWIDALRSTTFGALVLGHGFLWSDLVCYTAGVAFSIMIEKFSLRKFEIIRLNRKQN